MKPAYRRAALVAALAATLVAAWFAPNDGAGDVLLAARASRGAEQPAADTRSAGQDMAVLRLRERAMGEADDAVRERLFDPAQWDGATHSGQSQVTPAPAPPAPPLPTASATAPAAQAPPLPFLFLGRYEEDGKSVVFLQHMERNLPVRVGQTIAGQYRVESLSAGALTLRYLPLDQLQSLALDGSLTWDNKQ